ncbi:hypothetical protein [Rhodococcus gannanensis]|uniref:Trypsin n=1 Tax=Rhodococcus gannanensis TaxID=1960308 RepID=A0ABW4P8K4_9NOCA
MRNVILAGLTASLTLALPMPTAAWADVPSKTIAAGAFLDFDGNPVRHMGKNCTLGAVGTDADGRKVGIAAGHCNPYSEPDDVSALPGAPVGVHIERNDHPVWDKNDIEAGPIGWIRWVSPDMSYRSSIDYMVIEFEPHIQLSSRVLNASGDEVFRIDAVHRGTDGEPALPRVGDKVQNFGAASYEYGAESSNPVAHTPATGVVVESGDGLFRSWAPTQPGDSGGPLIMQGTSEWVGISTRARYDAFPQWESTSAQTILADLNSRAITGSGFVVTDSDD